MKHVARIEQWSIEKQLTRTFESPLHYVLALSHSETGFMKPRPMKQVAQCDSALTSIFREVWKYLQMRASQNITIVANSAIQVCAEDMSFVSKYYGITHYFDYSYCYKSRSEFSQSDKNRRQNQRSRVQLWYVNPVRVSELGDNTSVIEWFAGIN